MLSSSTGTKVGLNGLHPVAACSLAASGGNGAATSVLFALDEVGLLHRENAVLVGQINAENPSVK